MSETLNMKSIQFPNTPTPFQVRDGRIPNITGAGQQMVTNANGGVNLTPFDTSLQTPNVAPDSQTVGNAVNGKAPVIVNESTGSIILVDDSADMPLQGLTLYGKTTQAGTPTPESPVPMVSAGEGGSIVVKVNGKNLLPDNVVSAGAFVGGAGNVYTAKSTGNNLIATVRLLAGVTYTLSQRLVSGTGALPCIIIRKPDGTNIISNYANSNNPVTYTATEDVTADIRLQSQASATETTIGDSYAVMLEFGSRATVFEPYKDGGSMTVNTPNGLPGIPVASGGNYTDENGQQWICNERDYERGVYVQRVLAYAFDGSENVQKNNSAVGNYFEVLDKTFAGTTYKPICNRLPYVTDNTLWTTDADGISSGSAYSPIRMRFTSLGIDSADALKAKLSEWYAAGEPLVVCGILATPIETPIPADELAAYKALRTIAPNTTVYNDAGAGMKVDYAADTKEWVKDASVAMIGAPENGMVATKNYAIGDFIVNKDSLMLYRATSAIATGENITPGTNCTATTIVEQLENIYSLLNTNN